MAKTVNGVTVDMERVGAEYLTALKKIPAPKSWMRYSKVRVNSQYSEISAFHGYIPRALRHSGEGQVSQRDQEAYDVWEQATSDVIFDFEVKYPGIVFSTELGPERGVGRS